MAVVARAPPLGDTAFTAFRGEQAVSARAPHTAVQASRNRIIVDIRKGNGTSIGAEPPDRPHPSPPGGAAPTKWYEAPKIDEPVDYTRDGERITRVRSGGATDCVFTRSPATGIDAIEKQGKERIAPCPPDATPAHMQAWRTSRGTGLE